ncbi:hypothetical protein GGI35DRAFT_94671 [Trichoderma velutinum]
MGNGLFDIVLSIIYKGVPMSMPAATTSAVSVYLEEVNNNNPQVSHGLNSNPTLRLTKMPTIYVDSHVNVFTLVFPTSGMERVHCAPFLVIHLQHYRTTYRLPLCRQSVRKMISRKHQLMMKLFSSIASPLAPSLHQPLFTTDQRENAEMANLSNGCLAMVMGNAYTQDTLIFDHIHRRDAKSDGIQHYLLDHLAATRIIRETLPSRWKPKSR